MLECDSLGNAEPATDIKARAQNLERFCRKK
jgi:hypothetical protein